MYVGVCLQFTNSASQPPQPPQIFPEVIKRWSDALKCAYDTEKDDTARLHAQLALQAMRELKVEMREMLGGAARSSQSSNKFVMKIP